MIKRYFNLRMFFLIIFSAVIGFTIGRIIGLIIYHLFFK